MSVRPPAGAPVGDLGAHGAAAEAEEDDARLAAGAERRGGGAEGVVDGEGDVVAGGVRGGRRSVGGEGSGEGQCRERGGREGGQRGVGVGRVGAAHPKGVESTWTRVWT